jgi:two-component sensor histidine kinase
MTTWAIPWLGGHGERRNAPRRQADYEASRELAVSLTIRGRRSGKSCLPGRREMARRETDPLLSASLAAIPEIGEHWMQLFIEQSHRWKNAFQMAMALIETSPRDSHGSMSARAVNAYVGYLRAIAEMQNTVDRQIRSGSPDCDVTRLVEDISAAARKTFPDFEVTFSSEGPLTLDSNRATALLLTANELLTNAAKHGAGRACMSLQRDEGGQVSFTVQDDGPGVPPEFDPVCAIGGGMELLHILAGHTLRGCISFTNAVPRGLFVELSFADR